MTAHARKILLTLHGLLGLVTGLVVFLVAITGCGWVFKEEIEALLSDSVPIPIRAQPTIPPSQAKAVAQAVFPGHAIHGVAYSSKSNEPIEVIFYEIAPAFYQSVFIHPYQPEVLRTVDHHSGVFAWLLDGHRYLWLPPTVGTHVVRVSVLLFLLILISGLVLWWPKNRKGARQRLRFRWKPTTRWRRKNFDLHAITGFYVCLLALLLALTGSVMGYDWFYRTAYASLGGDQEPSFTVPANVSGPPAPLAPPEDRLLPQLRAEQDGAVRWEIHEPISDTASLYVEVTYQPGLYYDADYRFFDARTLAEIDVDGIYGKYAQAELPARVMRLNYDVHVGAIGGLVGKTLAFLASLVTASLPLTGTLLWWGRRKKQRTRSKANTQQQQPVTHVY